jgi:hypothetical protein
MKKPLLFLSLLCLVNALSAQWNFSTVTPTDIYNTTGGNVGIRIPTPLYPLHIWDGGTNIYTGIGLIPGASPNEDAVIQSLKPFNYGLLLRAQSQDASRGQAAIHLKCANNATSQITLMSDFIDFRTGINYTDIITGNTFGGSALYINNNQQVGIGTTNPGSFKLAVEGSLGARKIHVTLNNPWPDYVFSKKYSLLPISQLELFVKKNNHLPNVPTAEEVKAKGIELGEMTEKLLEKVEELSLYIIALNKRMEDLQKENTAIRKALGRK